MKYQIVYDKPAVKFLNVSYTLMDMAAKETAKADNNTAPQSDNG